MRFLGRVDDLVAAECAGLTESLSADFTDERPCSSVHRHVPSEVVVGIEHLTTVLTGVYLLLRRVSSVTGCVG